MIFYVGLIVLAVIVVVRGIQAFRECESPIVVSPLGRAALMKAILQHNRILIPRALKSGFPQTYIATQGFKLRIGRFVNPQNMYVAGEVSMAKFIWLLFRETRTMAFPVEVVRQILESCDFQNSYYTELAMKEFALYWG